mgnify:CR=1 FL=1
MSENSAIEWCDATWNPVLGCAKVSEGCRGCYAIPQAWMKRSNPSATVREAYSGLVEKRPDGSLNWTGRVNLVPERLPLPLTWKRPKRIFVNSLSDLFHESVPDEFIDRVFATMAITDHTFLVLTKRPHRMFSYLTNSLRESAVIEAMDDDYDAVPAGQWTWPLPNVWVGTSTEDQRTADERIPHLLRVPAAVRFLSCEPLLGPINLHPWMGHWAGVDVVEGAPIAVGARLIPNPIRVPKIHWVICGGESGPKARPMHPDWARSLRDQCISAGVAFHFKQWGEWAPTVVTPGGDLGGDLRRGHTRHLHGPGNPEGHFRKGDAYVSRVGKHNAGRELDGRTWDQFPSAAVPS